MPTDPCYEYAVRLSRQTLEKKIPLNKILDHHYPEYYQKMQETLDNFNRKSPNPIQCTAKCDACCHFQLASVPMEAKYIQYHSQKNLPKKQYKYVSHKIKQVYAKEREIEKRFPNDFIRQARVFRRFKIPCPFLNADRTCLIYDFRPMICRYHNVTSSTEHCYSFKDINKVTPWKHPDIMVTDVNFQKFMSQLYLNKPEQGTLNRLLLENGF